jgi:hypothetical protein
METVPEPLLPSVIFNWLLLYCVILIFITHLFLYLLRYYIVIIG